MKSPGNYFLLFGIFISTLKYLHSLVPPHCVGVKEKAHAVYYALPSAYVTSTNDMIWIQHGGKKPDKCAFMTEYYANQNMSECLNHCYDYGRKTRRKRQTDIDCLVDPIECDPSAKYRSADGSCNNLDNPMWGMANKGQARLVPNAYEDGLQVPRSRGCRNKPLPTPRYISNTVHKTGGGLKTEIAITLFMMQWGQFLAHDIVLTPIETNNAGDVLDCCSRDLGDPRCLAMTMSQSDDKFKAGECMDFQRSVGRINCQGERNPNNRQTAYIDASMVYGASDEMQASLRSFKRGMLRLNYKKLIVDLDDKSCDLDRPMNAKDNYCLAAGDERVNEWPGLAALHTLFSREHNRIAKKLYKLNKSWKDERIYQEARKIVAAEIQFITYKEFLPLFIRKKVMKKYNIKLEKSGFKTTYDPNVDATILNSLSTAILRMGHSFIHDKLGRTTESLDVIQEDALNSHFFKPELYHLNGSKGLEQLLFWAGRTLCPKSDRFMQNSVRNELFPDDDGHSLDLAALNLQRGRDHGLPGYNEFREACGLSRATHFDTTEGGLVDHDEKDAKLLSQVYSCPDDIDLFTGSLTERKLSGVVTGPLQECIMAKQFSRLRHGDRFFFENRNIDIGFTRTQLDEIRKMRLSSVMCANTEANGFQKRIFHRPSRSNSLNKCKLIPKIDLSLWKEDETSV